MLNCSSLLRNRYLKLFWSLVKSSCVLLLFPYLLFSTVRLHRCTWLEKGVLFLRSNILHCSLFFPSPVAFLFNWIGFFLSFCLTSSAAGRYGAISGFGLSLIKWVLIVRVRAVIEYSVLPAQILNGSSVVCCCRVSVQLPTGSFFFSSFPPISLVILMDSTGCGGCSWLWVSLRK